MYVSECTPESSGVVLTALADSVVSPKIVPWEMADASVRATRERTHGENTPL